MPVVRDLLPVTYETIKHSIEETIPKTGRYSNYTNPRIIL